MSDTILYANGPVDLGFGAGGQIKPYCLTAAGSIGFPRHGVARTDGQVDRTVKLYVNTGWSPGGHARRSGRKKISALATGGGTLYWRVRALDHDKVLVCGSSVKTLKIDPGTWTLSDLDLSPVAPNVSWTHAGDGIVKYSIQVSVDPLFPNTTTKTTKVPAISIAATNYTLTATEKARLLSLAAHNATSTLYYRVRGEDADRAFITYSDSETTTVP